MQLVYDRLEFYVSLRSNLTCAAHALRALTRRRAGGYRSGGKRWGGSVPLAFGNTTEPSLVARTDVESVLGAWVLRDHWGVLVPRDAGKPVGILSGYNCPEGRWKASQCSLTRQVCFGSGPCPLMMMLM